MNNLVLYFGFVALMSLMACNEKQEMRAPHPVKEEVLSHLAHPWSMAFLSEDEVLIAEKDSGIVWANLATGDRRDISGMPSDVADSIRVKFGGDNAAYFQILLDPHFAQNERIFLSYAAKGPGGTTTQVISARYTDYHLSDHKVLLTGDPFSSDRVHYGGGMVIGGDEKLYAVIGERYFREIDQPQLPVSQDYQDRRGKMFRLNLDGSIPDDNPIFEEEAVPGLYALGIRATQGLALAPNGRDIWFTDHGTRQGDEFNLLEKGGNYGWPIITSGQYRDLDYLPPDLDRDFTDPKWFWPHTVAPTGLCFYNGDEFPTWKDNLIVPGLSRGSLWRFVIRDNEVQSAEELFVNDRVRIRKAVMSPGGKLYILTDDLSPEKNGRVIRIINSKSI